MIIKMLQNSGFTINEIKHIIIICENPAECDTSYDEMINKKCMKLKRESMR